MTVARSVSDVLTEHVRFEIDCIDRMYLNVYVPQLQYAAGLVGYVHRQLGLPIASTAPLARITDAFGAAVRRFARDNGIAWVDFAKGQRKDDVMHEQLQHFTAAEGVVFIGRAQEKTNLFRTEKRRDGNGDSPSRGARAGRACIPRCFRGADHRADSSGRRGVVRPGHRLPHRPCDRHLRRAHRRPDGLDQRRRHSRRGTRNRPRRRKSP